MTRLDPLPLSRPISVRGVSKAGDRIAVDATEAERLAVARYLDLPAVARLVAEMDVVPRAGGILEISGTLEADVSQLCTVTLEPFPVTIREEIAIRFAPPERVEKHKSIEVERSLDDEEPPEPLQGESIDAGALTLEALALALDPWPRKPGIVFKDHVEDDGKEAHPFAALAALKQEDGLP